MRFWNILILEALVKVSSSNSCTSCSLCRRSGLLLLLLSWLSLVSLSGMSSGWVCLWCLAFSSKMTKLVTVVTPQFAFVQANLGVRGVAWNGSSCSSVEPFCS
ncbi:hypothetical protein L1987_37768 [Smallanthus sonchifolius]|uniref:Uncharacterized protein n=1 Tax=Smallanthus sonchifolius TaxID=185202 RepID=A0ACB9HIH5_9ASTR|nr:hypothetical protein L1987_37768 [Smallanthus sonchifolius]